MKHNIHSRGDFLNKPFYHSDGTMFSKIVIDEEVNGYIGWDCEFKIRDCNKTIDLSFYLDEGELENGIHKIEIMIAHLREFRKAFKKGANLYTKLKQKSKTLKNEKEN